MSWHLRLLDSWRAQCGWHPGLAPRLLPPAPLHPTRLCCPRPPPHPSQAPGGGRSSIGAPDPQQLKEAEASVMRLEKDLGTSHPEVGAELAYGNRTCLWRAELACAKHLLRRSRACSAGLPDIFPLACLVPAHASKPAFALPAGGQGVPLSLPPRPGPLQ